MSYTLDVGCGSGQNQQFMHIKHRGNINTDILKPIKPIPDFVQCDAQHLPFKDKAFTRSLLIDVLEHVDSPSQSLKELKRVTQKEVVVGTPNAMYFKKTLRSYIKGDYLPYPEHITTWGIPELTNLCRHAGFKNIKIDGSEYRVKERNVYRFIRMFFPQKMRKRQLVASLTV